jgi:hypothetical protein
MNVTTEDRKICEECEDYPNEAEARKAMLAKGEAEEGKPEA